MGSTDDTRRHNHFSRRVLCPHCHRGFVVVVLKNGNIRHADVGEQHSTGRHLMHNAYASDRLGKRRKRDPYASAQEMLRDPRINPIRKRGKIVMVVKRWHRSDKPP